MQTIHVLTQNIPVLVYTEPLEQVIGTRTNADGVGLQCSQCCVSTTMAIVPRCLGTGGFDPAAPFQSPNTGKSAADQWLLNLSAVTQLDLNSSLLTAATIFPPAPRPPGYTLPKPRLGPE